MAAAHRRRSALSRYLRGRLDREIEEGVLLARYAVRMDVKNRIVVETIGDGDRFDADHAALQARGRLGVLQHEALESAARMADVARTVAHVEGRAVHEHDYRSYDRANLRRRRRVYRGVAERLAEIQSDDDAVAALVEQARNDAWGEIGAEIRRGLAVRAAAPAPLPPEERELQRQMLVAMDLTALAVERGVDLEDLRGQGG